MPAPGFSRVAGDAERHDFGHFLRLTAAFRSKREKWHNRRVQALPPR